MNLQLPSASLGIVLACCLLTPGAACAQATLQRSGQELGPKPEIAGAFVASEASATVETVDPQAGHVLLRLPDGSLATLRVGPEVRNLDQLKPGDRVAARYVTAAAVRLANPEATSGVPANQAGGGVAPAAQDQAGTAGGQMRAVGTVVGLDPSRNNISFIGPNNRIQTVTVPDANTAAVAKTLKVGDRVDVTYTEGVAISLQPVG